MDSLLNLMKYLEGLDNMSLSVLFHEVEDPDSISTVNNKFTTSNYSSVLLVTPLTSINYLQSLNGEEHKD